MGICISAEESVVDEATEAAKRNSGLNRNLLRSRKDQDVYKYYTVLKTLGEGSLGAVSSCRKKEVGGSAYNSEHGIFSIFKAKSNEDRTSPPKRMNTSEHIREYALKSIQTSRISEQFLDEMRNEIDILRTLDHPNIVKAYEVFETKKQITIVMDLCSGGDLYTRGPYSEKQAAAIVGKILSGIAYMHSKNIVHRDLKFENIMWESKREDAEIKIIDFGLSAKYIPGSYMREGVGTVYTMSPQVLQGVYTNQADLWSIGVITYMLLSSTKPFYHRKRRYMIDRIMRCDYNFHGRHWEHVSKPAKDFVAAILKLDPEERLTAKQALDHEWLNSSFSLSDRRPDSLLMKDVHGQITSYGEAGEFKKLVLQVLAHKSSTEDIVNLRSVFDQYDSDNDGTITLAELKAELDKQGSYSDAEVEELFSHIDVNNTGIVDYTEFLAATLEVHGKIEEERLAEAFDRIDADDTGYISRKNLLGILGKDFSPERADKIMEEADHNSDGRISFPEFLQIMRRSNNNIISEVAHMSGHNGDTNRNESELFTLSAGIPGGRAVA